MNASRMSEIAARMHMDEWHELSHAHMIAEKAMRAAYRATLSGSAQDKEGT